MSGRGGRAAVIAARGSFALVAVAVVLACVSALMVKFVESRTLAT